MPSRPTTTGIKWHELMRDIAQYCTPVFFELNAVAAISAHRSFRAAATELGISPSALSHAIAGLERRLGVRLINRTTRSVSLSEAGEHFLAPVSPALREIAGAMEDVNEFRDTPTGTLCINLNERAAHQILRPVVANFLRRYSDMNVELALEGRPIDIVAEGFDAGVRLAEAVPQDMVAIPCGPDSRFIVVGAPAYSNVHRCHGHLRICSTTNAFAGACRAVSFIAGSSKNAARRRLWMCRIGSPSIMTS
jgi:DNA-binding transcriptional LysR family regulator